MGGPVARVSTWAQNQIRAIAIDLSFGRFDLAREKISEIEKRGLFFEHAKNLDITIDSFVNAVFSERLSCGLERRGIFTFRQVCHQRPENLYAIPNLPHREIEELISFCRQQFARSVPRVEEVDE